MAKIGEGDPRWVVREREDGTNVNGWHWGGERDVLGWADTRLREMLMSVSGDNTKISKVSKVEGEAKLYTRKGALKPIYDLTVSGEWTALAADATGKFDFELYDDDPMVNTTCDTPAAGGATKSAFVSECVPKIRELCATFTKEIASGADLAGQPGLPLPSVKGKNSQGESLDEVLKMPESNVTDFKRTPGVDASSAAVVEKSNKGKPFTITDGFTCLPSDLYKCFVDPPRLQAISRGKVICEPRVGGTWEILGGMCSGIIREVNPDSQIVMDWRMKDWDDKDPSCKLELDFENNDGRTKLKISLYELPADKRAPVEGFWRIQILRAIKAIFGYGSASFL